MLYDCWQEGSCTISSVSKSYFRRLYMIFDWTEVFVLVLYIPVNNFSDMLGCFFQSWTSTKQRVKCLSQGHKAVHLMMLKLTTPRSLAKHSTTKLLHSSIQNSIIFLLLNIFLSYTIISFMFLMSHLNIHVLSAQKCLLETTLFEYPQYVWLRNVPTICLAEKCTHNMFGWEMLIIKFLLHTLPRGLVLNSLPPGKLFMLFCCLVFWKINFFGKILSGIPSKFQIVWQFVGPDLGPNCLQYVSADDTRL